MNTQASHAGTMQQVQGNGVPDPDSLPTLKGAVSEEEWKLRCDLAATYRLAAHFGWDDLIFTHISVRLPDENGKARFLLNPYGLFFDEITASSLIKIGMDGNLVAESPYFSNPAGFFSNFVLHRRRTAKRFKFVQSSTYECRHHAEHHKEQRKTEQAPAKQP